MRSKLLVQMLDLAEDGVKFPIIVIFVSKKIPPGSAISST